MNLKFPMRKSGSLLAFATLGMAAGSAFSQSMEYRRGYEQGYRDGVEAAGAQAQSAPMMIGRITILEARYGIREAACDARENIQQMASRRRHIDVRVSNELCGDPAPNRPKRLFITYRCGDGPELRVNGPENSTLAMNCR